MPTHEDFLDRLWREVVNIDPEGKWIARAIETCRPVKKGAYARSASALERLAAIGTAKDLGRISRESRYSACFDLLCSLNDSGLSQRALQTVITLLKQSLVSKVSKLKSVAEFW